MDGILKDIPDRNPVFAGALHTDILAVIVKEPLLESEQATVKSGEAFLLVLGQHKTACNDCGDEKGFVNIDTTADLVGKFHDDPPSCIGKREAGTEPPHIKLR